MKASIVLVAGALAGCSSLPETSFYMLAADRTESAYAAPLDGPVLGIGRVDVADYLKRRGIVTQTADFRIHAANYHRWAEPLHDGVRRSIGWQLSHALRCCRVEADPEDRRQLDYQLDVEVDRFHATAAGAVVFGGRWTLRRIDSGAIVLSQGFSLEAAMAVAVICAPS